MCHPFFDGYSTSTKFLLDEEGKGRDSSFQEGVLHTYILRLD